MTSGPVEIFVTALRGTEVALRDELREFGLRGARADRGGVRVRCAGGDDDVLATALHVCLWTRIGAGAL